MAFPPLVGLAGTGSPCSLSCSDSVTLTKVPRTTRSLAHRWQPVHVFASPSGTPNDGRVCASAEWLDSSLRLAAEIAGSYPYRHVRRQRSLALQSMCSCQSHSSQPPPAFCFSPLPKRALSNKLGASTTWADSRESVQGGRRSTAVCSHGLCGSAEADERAHKLASSGCAQQRVPYLHPRMRRSSSKGILLRLRTGMPRSSSAIQAGSDGMLPVTGSKSGPTSLGSGMIMGKGKVAQTGDAGKADKEDAGGLTDLQGIYHQGLADSRVLEEAGEGEGSEARKLKIGERVRRERISSESETGKVKKTPVGEMLTEWGAPAVESHRELVEQLGEGWWQEGWEDESESGQVRSLRASYARLVRILRKGAAKTMLAKNQLSEAMRERLPLASSEDGEGMVVPWNDERDTGGSVEELMKGRGESSVGAKGWEWKKLVGILFVVLLMCSIDRASMSVAQISMAKDFAYSDVAKGFIGSAFFFGYTFSQVAGGVLSARHGGRLVLGSALAWWSTCTLLTPLAAKHSLACLLFTRVMLGLGEGVALPTVTGMLAQQVPLHARSRATAFVFSGTSLGTILCLYACPNIIALFGSWPWLFYVFGSMGIAASVLWVMLAPQRSSHQSHTPPSLHPPDLDDPQLMEPSLQVLPRYASLALSSSPPPSPSPSPTPTPKPDALFVNKATRMTAAQVPSVEDSSADTQTLSKQFGFPVARRGHNLQGQDSAKGPLPQSLDGSLMTGQPGAVPERGTEAGGKPVSASEGDVPWAEFFRAPAMWAIMGAHVASAWNHHLILVWLPTYLSTRLHLDLPGASMAAVVPWIASFVALNMVGWIADWMFSTHLERVQVRKICQAIAFLGPAACLLRLVVCDSPSEAPFLLSTVLALSNFSAGGFFSNHPDLSQKYAGILFGITNSLGSIAGCVSITLTGVILDLTAGNWSYVWLSSAAIYVVATIWYALLASTERHFDVAEKLN